MLVPPVPAGGMSDVFFSLLCGPVRKRALPYELSGKERTFWLFAIAIVGLGRSSTESLYKPRRGLVLLTKH